MKRTNLKSATVTTHPVLKDAILTTLVTDDGIIEVSIPRPVARQFIEDLDNSTSF
jgi:hypothetical protein